MIKLYHGSTVDIKMIDLLKSRPNKDFGRGFYLSADRQQAWRMGEFKALTEGGSPVIIFLNRNNKTAIPAHDYDIVYGPIANDRVGVQIGKYEAGDITLDQFLENLKYIKGVTFQYYFGTERAIAKLTKI